LQYEEKSREIEIDNIYLESLLAPGCRDFLEEKSRAPNKQHIDFLEYIFKKKVLY
jgi:hypothetical protein